MSLDRHALKALAIEFAAMLPPSDGAADRKALRLATAHLQSVDVLLARIMADEGGHVMLAHAARKLIEASSAQDVRAPRR